MPTEAEPNSSQDLYDKETGDLLQRRYYGKNGKAVKDIDYKHEDGGNNHTFQHEHYWDWTKKSTKILGEI